MAFDIIALFRGAGIGIDQGGEPNIPPGMVEWIGRVTVLPRKLFGKGLKVGSEIWQVPKGFARFDQSGFESWLVDAPAGENLLISLRDIAFDHHEVSTRTELGIHIWNFEQLSNFIGAAILQGCMSIEESDSIELDERVVESKSELDRWIDSGPIMIGDLDSSSGKPMLRPIGMWAIRGYLRCGELSEDAEWLVIDEGSEFRLLDPSEDFLHPPRLEHLPAIQRSISERNELLTDLLSESRRTDSEDDSSLSHMRSWTFSLDSAQIIAIKCFRPEWV